MCEFSDFITDELSKKTRVKLTVEDWHDNIKIDSVSEYEIERIANSDSFRKKMFLAGFNDFGYSDGSRNFSNVALNRKNKITFPGKSSKKFLDDAFELRKEYIRSIFKTQDDLDFLFYLSGTGFCWCWPRPTSFSNTELMYETDHLNSKRRGGIDSLTNFAFLSANTNQFIKSQLTLERLLDIHEKKLQLCDRIRNNIKQRDIYFKSDEWFDLQNRIEKFQ